MPRGHFWEATYDPAWEGPTEKASFTSADSGLVERVVAAQDGKPVSVRWRASDPHRLFQKCDIAEIVKDSLVSNCTFTDCRFRGSRWIYVKFSKCTFVRCDFTDVTFERCYFVSDCRFEHNSASAELFRIEETAISATSFMNGLETNLGHTDRVEYQRHRFVGTREKLAKALFSATRNEADVDYYFEAYEQLTRCTLERRIEQHRFEGDLARAWWQFWLLSIPARLERRIVITSGWLTQWGRSLLRAFGFFAVVVALFGVLYAGLDTAQADETRWHFFGRQFVQALNVTLVAGYTAHFDRHASWIQQVTWLGNVALGIFWYSLIVPVLSRRVLR
jgi:uncharacterized protein YjbI with pentapeptide repeats